MQESRFQQGTLLLLHLYTANSPYMWTHDEQQRFTACTRAVGENMVVELWYFPVSAESYSVNNIMTKSPLSTPWGYQLCFCFCFLTHASRRKYSPVFIFLKHDPKHFFFMFPVYFFDNMHIKHQVDAREQHICSTSLLIDSVNSPPVGPLVISLISPITAWAGQCGNICFLFICYSLSTPGNYLCKQQPT